MLEMMLASGSAINLPVEDFTSYGSGEPPSTLFSGEVPAYYSSDSSKIFIQSNDLIITTNKGGLKVIGDYEFLELNLPAEFSTITIDITDIGYGHYSDSYDLAVKVGSGEITLIAEGKTDYEGLYTADISGGEVIQILFRHNGPYNRATELTFELNSLTIE